ncbi:unnamed protein product [Larinioides sclopetarius]|uniref:Uncharacterized protein n=1 Tax=Larinioides sclopetarius TaxID=280406 RepID=A0AAV2AS73_9ARAC
MLSASSGVGGILFIPYLKPHIRSDTFHEKHSPFTSASPAPSTLSSGHYGRVGRPASGEGKSLFVSLSRGRSHFEMRSLSTQTALFPRVLLKTFSSATVPPKLSRADREDSLDHCRSSVTHSWTASSRSADHRTGIGSSPPLPPANEGRRSQGGRLSRLPSDICRSSRYPTNFGEWSRTANAFHRACRRYLKEAGL